MSTTRWEEVDRYLVETLVGEDEVLRSAVAASEAAGLPAIQVTATQGRLLELFARMLGARTILEIGTLGGYSTIWLARGLAPDGRVITLERDPKHAEVALRNFARAELSSSIELRLGAALDVLPTLTTEGPFDLVFIDADKPSLPEYFTWALRLSRPGTLILVDNVVREGDVVNAASEDASVQGVRRMNELIAAEPRVRATVLQTVGAKGYDGLAFVLVEE